MFQKTSSQKSFFDVNNIFPNALPANDWSNVYRDKVYPLIDEDKFKHLYKEEGGQPIKSIKVKVSVLIFMGLEQLTWRSAEFQFIRRLDWLNATRTPLGSGAIDHTTLLNFIRNQKVTRRLENYFKS